MQIIKMGLILMLVTLLAAAALSWVNQKTKPIIDRFKKEKEIRALDDVLPEAKSGVIVPVIKNGQGSYFIGYGSRDTTGLVGYACRAEGKGYSSTIKAIVGVDCLGKINNVVILEQKETPGLGTKIGKAAICGGENRPWYAQFRGRTAAGLAVDKDGGEIAAITGATISSRAVTDAVRLSVQTLEKQLGGFKSPALAVPDSSLSDSTVKEK